MYLLLDDQKYKVLNTDTVISYSIHTMLATTNSENRYRVVAETDNGHIFIASDLTEGECRTLINTIIYSILSGIKNTSIAALIDKIRNVKEESRNEDDTVDEPR